MNTREELDLILNLIRKYNLPLSPILEYAIKEKMEEYPDSTNSQNTITNQGSLNQSNNEVFEKEELKVEENTSDKLRIIGYSERSFAVLGNTKNHKEELKSMGGFYKPYSQWGPIWIFRNSKRDIVNSYIKVGNKVLSLLKNVNSEKTLGNSRYVISIKYPDGRIFCSKIVWETLVDVIKYADPERVSQLHITCLDDNLVTSKLHNNPLYRNSQKKVGNGFYVSTYTSTETKYKQITLINRKLNLGLIIEKIPSNNSSENKNDAETPDIDVTNNTRDTTKYSFNGSAFLSKRRFVLEVVKHYVLTHPGISFESLIRIFPKSLNTNRKYGVINNYYDIVRDVMLNPDLSKRFFLKKDEIISLSHGTRVVVHNQWGEDFKNFLSVAEKLYDVKSDNEYCANNSSTNKNPNIDDELYKSLENTKDKRIGYTVRLLPSQFIGKVIGVRKDSKGIKKLVAMAKDGTTKEVQDLSYFYEVLSRK